MRLASLQAKSSSTYGTAGQKIIEKQWKIVEHPDSKASSTMLKDVERLSDLQGNSSEDRGRLGGDGGEANRGRSR